MQISTKFSPGDSAWTMINNKPVEVKIEGIVINIAHPRLLGYLYDENVDIFCIVSQDYKREVFEVGERLVWPTKRDLLDSL